MAQAAKLEEKLDSMATALGQQTEIMKALLQTLAGNQATPPAKDTPPPAKDTTPAAGPTATVSTAIGTTGFVPRPGRGIIQFNSDSRANPGYEIWTGVLNGEMQADGVPERFVIQVMRNPDGTWTNGTIKRPPPDNKLIGNFNLQSWEGKSHVVRLSFPGFHDVTFQPGLTSGFDGSPRRKCLRLQIVGVRDDSDRPL